MIVINGCSTQSINEDFMTIPVSISSFQKFKLESIIKEVEQVKLEETANSLVGQVYKVEKTNEHLFVLDSNGPRVLQFSLNGKFIKEMGISGNGPDEYSNLLTFTINSDSKHIYLATLRKIVRYDFNNNFIDSYSGVTFPEYVNFKNGLLEVYFTKEEASEDRNGFMKKSLLYKLKDNAMLIDSVVTKNINITRPVYTTFPKPKFLSTGSSYDYFYQPVLIPEAIVRDTLYELKGNKLLPALKLDFGSNLIGNNGVKSINIKSIIRSDNYLFAEYLNSGNRLFIYDFKQNQGYNLKEGINGGKFSDNEIIELFPLNNNMNSFYFNSKIVSNKEDNEPNPTIFFIQLK
jgi:hypothetical protein